VYYTGFNKNENGVLSRTPKFFYEKQEFINLCKRVFVNVKFPNDNDISILQQQGADFLMIQNAILRNWLEYTGAYLTNECDTLL